MKFNFKVLFGILFMIPVCLYGQDLTRYEISVNRKALAIEEATKRGVFIRKELEDGTIIELQDIDESGRLIYYKTLNADAASTTRTNALYAGSNLGLDLSGRNLIIGMWDGGSVQADHVEFAGRLQQFDNPTNKSEHSTHVLGTLIAKGINPAARGMAFNATAHLYDFNIDDPEMANAAGEGMLISNHSYGEVLGWSYNGNGWEWFGNNEVSNTEDYRFGLYNSASVSWDKIAFENPYYLIVKSAGNDRSDVGGGSGAPADGPFDTIDPQGVAKNVLTIGAVQALGQYTGPADIKMTNFSSWGPTDDGRIKPDLMGMGANVFSTAADGPQSYTELSGTSMSSPNVAGSLLLLQELYHGLNNSFMQSATLKGLAIHTALEAGNANGPDYSFGWGLFNAENAAKHILLNDGNDFVVDELTLPNATVYSREITLEKDNNAVFTISWTDRPGTANGAVLDPETLALVNDLDLRIIGPDNTEYLPWAMNPENKNAFKGDNFRDNVEKVQFVVPASGNYTISVSHKGTLSGGVQNFSLLASSDDVSGALNTLYYIGNNGEWENPQNWSRAQNGTPANQVPGARDIVLIGGNNTISVNSDVTCWAISSINNQQGTVQLNGNMLTIASHVVLRSGARLNGGTLQFSNPAGLSSSILSASADGLQNMTLVLDAQDFTLQVTKELHVDNIVINHGTLALGENDLFVNEMAFNGLGEKILEMQNSTLHLGSRMFIEDGSTLSLIGTTLSMTDGASLEAVNPLSEALPHVRVLPGSASIKGDLLISELEQQGKLALSGEIGVDNWLVQDNVTYSESVSVVIASTMQVDHARVPGIISLAGSPSKASLISQNANKFCFTGLDITNVDVFGNTKFVVDAASTVENSSGWIQQECSTVLAADFSFRFACARGITEFEDISDGNPESWLWDFGDNSETSPEQNPEHTFETAGVYLVTLTVSNGDETSEYTKMVNISNSTLNKPEVVETSGGLRSTSFASNYQWYFNGEPIEGADDFELMGPLEDGLYQVEIFNSSCRLRSEVYRVGITAIDDVLPESEFAIYPNPTSGDLFILPGDQRVDRVQVINVQGQVLFTKSRLTQEKITLDLGDLKSGVYFVLIEMGEVFTVHRVIRE